MKIVHIITRLILGGAQENTLLSCEGQHDRGHDVTLITGPPVGPEGSLLQRARGYGYRVIVVDEMLRSILPVKDFQTYQKLIGLLRKLKPDVVHTHSSKAGILGRLAAAAAGVPVVVHSIHGYPFHPRQPRAVRALWVALERLAARHTTHFVAVAQADIEEGVALGLFPRERATLVRSGIEIARFSGAGLDRAAKRRELGLDPGLPLAGMIGNFKPQKNPVDFVRVAARVAARVPGAQFLLAGDGPLRGAVEAEAARLGLGGRLRLLGWRRDPEEIVPCLDVLVLTSLWEGLPRVFPQAMAAGRPVVAYRVDGAPEAVVDGASGYLVEPGDVEGAAARVAELLLDPARAAAMGAAGRARVGEFDADLMVRRQEALYESLLTVSTRGRI